MLKTKKALMQEFYQKSVWLMLVVEKWPFKSDADNYDSHFRAEIWD